MDSKALPVFPQFEPLTISYKHAIQTVVNDFPSSDFNFAGLFTWNIDNSVLVSNLNGNVVIRSSDYLTHQKFYSFTGASRIDETIQTLIDYSREQGYKPELPLITQSSIAKIPNTNLYEISEDRDNADYILSVTDLVEFKANKYRGKKNLLNRFTRMYGEQSRASTLDLNDPSVTEDVYNVLAEWKKSRNKNTDETKDEFIAIQKTLDHHAAVNIEAFGVYFKDGLIAFTLFEILPTREAVIHFDKANVAYEGVFEYLKHNFAKYLATLQVEKINYEQDLGIEGLRRAKESYHPMEYIKKYTISLKPRA